MELARANEWLRVKPDADLEAHEEGEGQCDGHDSPRDHGEQPAAEPDATVGLVS